MTNHRLLITVDRALLRVWHDTPITPVATAASSCDSLAAIGTERAGALVGVGEVTRGARCRPRAPDARARERVRA